MIRQATGLLLGFTVASLLSAQTFPSRRLQFSLDREGPPTLQYTLVVGEDGAGLYTPHVVTAMLSEGQPPTGGDARVIRVAPALAKKLFAAIPMVQGGRCETHNKNIARTGVKVLHFQGTDRDAQCTFNFSDDDRVNDTTAAFEAVADTLQFGDRLRSKLRFDRLGLDGELDTLESAITEGRALEVGNIAPVLQAIVADERVMERARRRAARLLQTVPPSAVQASDAASPAADGSSPR